MSVVKIAVVNDVLRKVVNTTQYNDNDIPQDEGDLKYIPKLDWMAPNVEYGWTDESKTVRCVLDDCCWSIGHRIRMRKWKSNYGST